MGFSLFHYSCVDVTAGPTNVGIMNGVEDIANIRYLHLWQPASIGSHDQSMYVSTGTASVYDTAKPQNYTKQKCNPVHRTATTRTTNTGKSENANY